MSILWGVKNWGFSLIKPVTVNTGLRNCAPCDLKLRHADIDIILGEHYFEVVRNQDRVFT